MSATRALYRKYRPTKLSDVVGQSSVTETLTNSLKQDKISHAYLFIGPRGTGKTSVARILAHEINHFDYQIEDDYLDIVEIDAASNTGVDNIRELREKAIIAPTKGKYKVYIIDEIHMLSKSASNALLKTLEEPPEHIVFIMATTDANKVPITISSRAQVHHFKLADPATMQQHLRQIADAEKINITDGALEIVVRRGGGSFRDSLSLLDQIATLTGQEITADLLNSALGLPEQQIITDLLAAYANQDRDTLVSLIHDLLDRGLQPEIIASELISAIIANPQPTLLPLLARLPDVKAPFSEAKFLLAFLENAPATANPVAKPAASVATVPPTAEPASQAVPQASSTTTPKPPKITPAAAPAPKAPTKVQQPAAAETKETQKTQTKPVSAKPSTFDWNAFKTSVQDANTAIASQLDKVDFTCQKNCLNLYPHQKFTKNILAKSGNRNLLTSLLPENFTLQIHEVGEKTAPKDATLSQLSAIMGDVQEVSDNLPF